jgi:hypothetical protein
MTKTDDYRRTLKTLDDWIPYLLAESGLPGPRGNLSLAEAVADEGDSALFEQLLTYTPEVAPTNTPQEFLAFCGVVGLGKLVAQGQLDLLKRIRMYANDPRWRMREGVAMALQRLGDVDMARLLDEMTIWSKGTLLEQRAAACAVCEPRLLKNKVHAARTLDILDAITVSIKHLKERRGEDFEVLRKGLSYCWSVAVVALPESGKPLMEKWLADSDKDIRRIMKENLSKARLSRMDAAWVEACKQKFDD